MDERVQKAEERLATIEARLKTHWALQTENEFAEAYIRGLKNDLQTSIMRMALAAILLLAGSGYVFIKYAVNEQFNLENARLVEKLKQSYDRQVERTNSNFEWRRFHDYGKDYVNLAGLYHKSPIDEGQKRTEIHRLLDEAAAYFKKALEQGDMHASTYWELGELNYTYRIEMGLGKEADKFKAIEEYKNAAARYTETEISKGWRAEAYYKIGSVYWDLKNTRGGDDKTQDKAYLVAAEKYLSDANSEYAKLRSLSDERTRGNIEKISKLLAKIEQMKSD